MLGIEQVSDKMALDLNITKSEQGENIGSIYPQEGTTVPPSRRRRARTLFSVAALQRLEQAFSTDRYPDIMSREHLAEQIGVQEARIQTWFQNKRSRLRRHRDPEIDPKAKISQNNNKKHQYKSENVTSPAAISNARKLQTTDAQYHSLSTQHPRDNTSGYSRPFKEHFTFKPQYGLVASDHPTVLYAPLVSALEGSFYMHHYPQYQSLSTSLLCPAGVLPMCSFSTSQVKKHTKQISVHGKSGSQQFFRPFEDDKSLQKST